MAQKFDWRSLQKYLSGESVKDFDRFLDNLPSTVGVQALAATGAAWLIAGLAVMFASGEISKASTLRAELLEVEALKPPVPKISYVSVSETQLKDSIKPLENLYPGITFRVAGSGRLEVNGSNVMHYPQFRGAISHIQSMSRNWRVSFEKLCFGRECSKSGLSAELKIELARVQEPEKLVAIGERALNTETEEANPENTTPSE